MNEWTGGVAGKIGIRMREREREDRNTWLGVDRISGLLEKEREREKEDRCCDLLVK